MVTPARGELGRRGARLSACATCFGVALASLGVNAPQAAEHEINTRAGQWIPVVLFVAPGDTIVWHGMSGHETELITGMAPTGAAAWHSKLGEEGFKVVLDAEGAYLYKCHTHINNGMIGAIVVGDGEPSNLAAIESTLESLERVERTFATRVVARLKRELRRRAGL